MITTIVIVGLALYWLMIETAWLTVRLPGGGLDLRSLTSDGIEKLNFELEPARREYAGYHQVMSEEVRHDNIIGSIKKSLSPTITDILCGWEWVELNWNVVPVCTFELRNNGSRHSMTFNSGQAIRGAVKSTMNIYKEGYKPRALPSIKGHRNKAGGMVYPMTIGRKA